MVMGYMCILGVLRALLWTSLSCKVLANCCDFVKRVALLLVCCLLMLGVCDVCGTRDGRMGMYMDFRYMVVVMVDMC